MLLNEETIPTTPEVEPEATPQAEPAKTQDEIIAELRAENETYKKESEDKKYLEKVKELGIKDQYAEAFRTQIEALTDENKAQFKAKYAEIFKTSTGSAFSSGQTPQEPAKKEDTSYLEKTRRAGMIG